MIATVKILEYLNNVGKDHACMYVHNLNLMWLCTLEFVQWFDHQGCWACSSSAR